MLVAKNIHKKYGLLDVLQGVDLHIREAEMVALTGPSGAGKTTLLHILGTIDKPDSGEVFVRQQAVSRLSERKLNVLRNQQLGFVFQFHHLLPELSAWENVALPAWIAKKAPWPTKERALFLLEKVGLLARRDHKPKQLSGGECQRIAVARALMNEPQLILADEPSGNLDQKNAQQLHDLFCAINQDSKQTFLIVSHNEKITRQCGRIIHLEDGKITT